MWRKPDALSGPDDQDRFSIESRSLNRDPFRPRHIFHFGFTFGLISSATRTVVECGPITLYTFDPATQVKAAIMDIPITDIPNANRYLTAAKVYASRPKFLH